MMDSDRRGDERARGGEGGGRGQGQSLLFSLTNPCSNKTSGFFCAKSQVSRLFHPYDTAMTSSPDQDNR